MEFSSSSSAAARDASTVSRWKHDRNAVVNRCEKKSSVDASCVVGAGQTGVYCKWVKRPQSAVQLADAEFRKHSNESRNTSSLPPLTPSEILNWQLTDRTCCDDGLRRFGRSLPRSFILSCTQCSQPLHNRTAARTEESQSTSL